MTLVVVAGLAVCVTYFAAAAAGIAAKLIVERGSIAMAATVPIVAIIYFTYRTYRRAVTTTDEQIAQASRHIEEQRIVTDALRESEGRFRSAFDHAAVGLALVSREGGWESVNLSLCELLGYSTEELTEQTLHSVIHPDELGQTLADMVQIAEGKLVMQTRERRFLRPDGVIVWATVSLSSVVDAAGANIHVILQAQDITERKQAESELHQAAFFDSLTRLPNRALFQDHLKTAIDRTVSHPDHLVAVLFLDLDRFKNINDSLGHGVGDQLLKAVAGRLTSSVRPADTVSRFGGDEFAVLLDGVAGLQEVCVIADRILACLGASYRLSGYEVVTTGSVGITLSTIGYESTEDFLRDADTAMYRAKERGRGCYEIFDKFMHARALSRLQLENDLRRAVERKEFEVYYQPIVTLETQDISGFEALIRWKHPERGFISPADFIPVAEDTDLILPIGEWILLEACLQVRAWQLAFETETPFSISVNLSGKQFNQPDLVERIKRILRQTELSADSLRLEITESLVMENAEAAIAMLRQLRSIGVQISIDDFGTGYSSLSYLHRFPLSILKVDRSFVGRMTEDDESLSIVETIITLASKLKMKVVAEGIETTAQLEALKAFDCEFGQGFLFYKPLPAAAIEKIFDMPSPAQVSSFLPPSTVDAESAFVSRYSED